jgi:hypothetical protein
MSQIESNPAKAANAQVNPTPALGWDVFVTPGIRIVTIDLPPGITQAYFRRWRRPSSMARGTRCLWMRL